MCVCVSICIYIYHIFFIHSSVNGHLGCFHVLAIVNNALCCHFKETGGVPSSSLIPPGQCLTHLPSQPGPCGLLFATPV